MSNSKALYGQIEASLAKLITAMKSEKNDRAAARITRVHARFLVCSGKYAKSLDRAAKVTGTVKQTAPKKKVAKKAAK